MSLNNALNAAVSGLSSQSASVAAVAENIANATTTAYKTRGVSFQSLVTNTSAGTANNQVGGGVIFKTRQNMEQQGLIQNTGVSTNVAINGQGFFVVTDDPNNQPSAFQYSRNGDFRTDENGLLINNERMILLGQKTDEAGAVIAANSSDLNSLSPIDLNTISGTSQATSKVTLKMNLPADAAIGATYSNAVEVFDPLGVSHTIVTEYKKTAANTWEATSADPVFTNNLNKQSGTIDFGNKSKKLTLAFNGDGSINTINPGNGAVPADIVNTDLTFNNGASNITFGLNLGTKGLKNGLTQSGSNTAKPAIEISLVDQDGVRFGQLSGVEIDDNGLVTATFDNGVRRPIFQIPIATFPNPAGLTNVNGTIYDENEQAGNYNLRLPGGGNAGVIEAVSIEQSATDTSKEFNKMIVAQQAYSSAAQIVSTTDDMFETLIGAVR